MKRLFHKIKAILRDWLFKDYKWITRAQVIREICVIRCRYKDHQVIQRILNDLQETIK